MGRVKTTGRTNERNEKYKKKRSSNEGTKRQRKRAVD
jgi:hypothetical protein